MENAAVMSALEKYPNYKEFLWFKAHEAELIQKYYARYIVIKDEKVVADYGTKELAREMTKDTLKPGTYIIQHCLPRSERRIPKFSRRQIVTVNG